MISNSGWASLIAPVLSAPPAPRKLSDEDIVRALRSAALEADCGAQNFAAYAESTRCPDSLRAHWREQAAARAEIARLGGEP